MQLSQKQQTFSAFFKTTLNIEHFPKKEDPHR